MMRSTNIACISNKQELVLNERSSNVHKKVTASSIREAWSDLSKHSFYETLKPTLTFMRIFGVYFDNKKNSSNFVVRFYKNGSLTFNYWKVYSGFVMTFLWTAVIKLPVIPFLSSKTAILFDPLFVIGENNSYGQVVRSCWLIFSVLVTTSYFRNCWKWVRFDEFFSLWEEVLLHNHFDWTEKLKNFYRRELILVALGILTCVSVTVCFFVFALLPVVVEHFSNELIISVIFSVIQVLFISGVCISSTVFFVLICLALKSRFKDISSNFENSFNHTSLQLDTPDLLTSGVLQHQQLCNLVELADDIVRPYICIALVVCIPIICLSLFDLIFVSLTIFQCIIKVIDILACFILLGVVTIAAASLSSAIHNPYEIFHKFSAGPLEVPHRLTVMIFTQILGGPSLGLTCSNLFVVTKSTILNMFSVLVSYFVVLVQLHS